ncbi:DNA glycosylase AlkZ-like family protein [Amycolatopsis sp. NPDC059021]|uniref:DNA glycosylase AlkZ-like family protein n=1 Tax=Amycolatopsis sp. NPDC059021 TaxID=3346704 RepID=UPI0036710B15
MTHPLTVSASHNASDKEAGELWNWLLRQQGLAAGVKFHSVADVAHAALGLHAARLPSPFATVLARSHTPTVALSLFTPQVRAEVTTVRCMRKTLHTLPLPLATAAHAATLHFRERDALRAVTNAGVGLRSVARAIDAIAALLADGPLFHRDIEARLIGPKRPLATIRLALKLAWERGTLTYVNDTVGWNRERRTFGLTATLYPELDTTMDRRKATRELVLAYFDRYGPATLKDVMWWSALSRSAVTSAMAESGREWVEVYAPWCDAPMYLYRDRLDAFRAAPAEERTTGVNFLAHEDVALKAYFESRRRYLGALPARRAFNQIGEVLPTIVAGGQVVGTWAWDEAGHKVTTSLARGYSTPELQGALTKQRRQLTTVLATGRAEHPRAARRLDSVLQPV